MAPGHRLRTILQLRGIGQKTTMVETVQTMFREGATPSLRMLLLCESCVDMPGPPCSVSQRTCPVPCDNIQVVCARSGVGTALVC